MKTFRIIGFALMAVLMCVACSNGLDEPQLEVEAGKTYEVSLNLGGDYIDVSETPLSRADEPKKYYAINVFCMKTDGSEASYTSYASGVFDNTEAMKITLLGGYKYNFVCTSVVEGVDKFYTKDNYLYWPSTNAVHQNNINKFITRGSFSNLGSGRVCYQYLYSASYNYYPQMDRYYGLTKEYIPTEGGTVTIPMKRCVFGVKVKVNGVPDGTLSWDFSHFNMNKRSHSGSEILECSSIYTFEDVSYCWEKAVAGVDYTQTFTINFTWKRSNSYTQTFSKQFTVKRNVMSTINVTLTGGSEEIGVGVDEERSEMINETTDVTFDGGSLNDTEVNPTE